jgi:hypothetical protein
MMVSDADKERMGYQAEHHSGGCAQPCARPHLTCAVISQFRFCPDNNIRFNNTAVCSVNKYWGGLRMRIL